MFAYISLLLELSEKTAATPTSASNKPTPNSMMGKNPLLVSLLDKYASTNKTALTLNGAMILTAFMKGLLKTGSGYDEPHRTKH